MITTPSARLRTLRSFFLIAQTPLLGEEGKTSPLQVGQHALKPAFKFKQKIVLVVERGLEGAVAQP
jgi:hypothetical protein